MDSLIGTLAVLGPIAIIVVVALYLKGMTWRRVWGVKRCLSLGEMLRRHDVGDVGAIRHSHEFAFATRRCAECSEEKACRKWLDAGKRRGYHEFCPNAEFIDRLKWMAAG